MDIVAVEGNTAMPCLLGFIPETFAVLTDHDDVVTCKGRACPSGIFASRNHVPERNAGLRIDDVGVRAVVVAHIHDVGLNVVSHDDAVAGVKACTLRVSVLHYRKVAEHVRIVFITAGCQDHAVLSSDILRSSVYFDNDAVNDSSLRVVNELLARSVVPNINVAFALVDVFLNQSVQSAVTAGRVNHGRSDGVGTRGIGIFGTNFNLRIFSAEELHIVKEAL